MSDTPTQHERWVDAATPDGSMSVFVSQPPDARNAVVVLQEAFGVNQYVQDVARRLAALGYLALAPDLFHRRERHTLGYDEREEAMAAISELGPDQIIPDVNAACELAASVAGIAESSVAVIGFCFGGRAAFTAATAGRPFAGTVVFYGPGIASGPWAVLDEIPQITGPVLMHVGSTDPTIPPADIHAIENAAWRRHDQYEPHVYDGAGHAFACDARPQLYHAQAASRAWAKTESFLQTAFHHPGRSHEEAG